MKTRQLLPPLVACLVAFTAFIACQNESSNNTTTTDDELTAPLEEEVPVPALPYVVVFDEGTEQPKVEQNPEFDTSLLTPEGITQLLAANYPEITPSVDSVSNNTLHVHIADATYLTQQMGSSGAYTYLTEATYAYTELPNVDTVHFLFEEGDHAVPGSYTRDSFSDGNIR